MHPRRSLRFRQKVAQSPVEQVVKTVETQRENIKNKLGDSNASQVVAAAACWLDETSLAIFAQGSLAGGDTNPPQIAITGASVGPSPEMASTAPLASRITVRCFSKFMASVVVAANRSEKVSLRVTT